MVVDAHLSVPDAPEDLVEACAIGDCVLCGGSGLSAQAGFPSWRRFVRDLLEWAYHQQWIDRDRFNVGQAALEQGHINAVADDLVSTMQVSQQQHALYSHMRSLFSAAPSPPPSDYQHLYQLLREINFAAILSHTFDELLEQTYPADTPIYTAHDGDALQEAVQKGKFFILKLGGVFDREETIAITPAQLVDITADNLAFLRSMEALYFSKTLLFIGVSLEGIETYLNIFGLRARRGHRSHYALVSIKEAGWEARAALLERRYNIKILPYTDPNTTHHPQIREFLERLIQQVKPRERLARKALSPTQLKRVCLEDIGPFEWLDLRLDPHWNIILGDNGVGKSNILKAIATSICGRDAESYAARLVKAGSTSGTITLETTRNTYTTEILLTEANTAELRSIPLRLLGTEGILAIGFPPLRPVSWNRPRAPQDILRRLPSSEDLMPLVVGSPDYRLERLKQWIVNIDYRSKTEEIFTGKYSRYEKLLDDFFAVINTLTDDLTIGRGRVNPETYEVTVMTDDGELPIEAVSQGMISLISWVGILLQRLYEVYADDEDPKQRYALVLIDEIDAHLHPSWQRTLVSNLSTLFPSVQFIATTHSPLVIAGLPAEQVMRFKRNSNGQIEQVEVEPEMTMGRADQILRGELFGLETTVGTSTEDKIKRYVELRSKPSLTEAEQQELQAIASEIPLRVPYETLSTKKRRQKDVFQAALLKQVATQIQHEYPNSSKMLLQQSEQLFAEVENETE